MLIDTLLYFGVEFLGFRNGVKKIRFWVSWIFEGDASIDTGEGFCGLDVCVASWGKKDWVKGEKHGVLGFFLSFFETCVLIKIKKQ